MDCRAARGAIRGVLADGTPSELRPLLDEAAARAHRLGRPVLVSSTRRVAPRDPLAVFATGVDQRGLWLRPGTGESLVGLGAARVLTADGAHRFSHIADAWRDLLRDAVLQSADGPRGTGPLLLGGFAFDPLRPGSGAWSGFGAARLVLPTTSLVQRDGAAWLTRNALVEPEKRHTDPRKASHASGGKRLQRHTDCRKASHERLLSADEWQTLVGSVVHGIRNGSLGLDKVVLARACHLSRATPFDPELPLRRLAQEYPSCTLFAVANGDACFLGATPERLAELQHGTVATAALAGSIRRGGTPEEDRALGAELLASPKERAEHEFVVRALRDGLSGVCTSVVGPAEPRLERLPNVQHLLTPLCADLAPERGLFDVAAALHPSPAVGGFPGERALAVIREREGLDRGWYGGPLGWVDAAGEGDLVVGIRSALLRGADAWLYAGCGIVAESDPAAERVESEWKLRPMRSALLADD
jgi:isochorismate synthase